VKLIAAHGLINADPWVTFQRIVPQLGIARNIGEIIEDETGVRPAICDSSNIASKSRRQKKRSARTPDFTVESPPGTVVSGLFTAMGKTKTTGVPFAIQ
jgi:hypothetical protein